MTKYGPRFVMTWDGDLLRQLDVRGGTETVPLDHNDDTTQQIIMYGLVSPWGNLGTHGLGRP